ncbi:hypothetical protein AKO1_015185 [Acrasis kona]|uniref:CSC1/OSCA1-like 7TM region domain-containing protein n=1 Tax=Acrasis kona TaxID=1008807 RepID=A0AAW2ZEP6_9EUKA
MVQRTIMRSTFAYLILSTLVLPSLLLTSVDAVIEFFVINRNKNVTVAFAKLFVPSNGAFFINYVLQRAILSNTIEMLQISSMVLYFWYTRLSSDKYAGAKLYRPMTPGEKLKAAEITDLRIEQEYGYICSVVGIGLCFGVFSPLILPACLLYLFVKHISDRFTVSFAYAHKRHTIDGSKTLYGSNMGFKSDFMSHSRNVLVLVEFILVNLFIMSTFLTLFFVAKTQVDGWFYLHSSLCFIMVLLSVASFVGLTVYQSAIFKKSRHIDHMNTTHPTVNNCRYAYVPPQGLLLQHNRDQSTMNSVGYGSLDNLV